MAEPGGAFSAYSAMTDKGNVDRGLRIAEFGAALAEPVAATVPLPLRFRIGRRTLMSCLFPRNHKSQSPSVRSTSNENHKALFPGAARVRRSLPLVENHREQVGEVGSSSAPTLWTVPFLGQPNR